MKFFNSNSKLNFFSNLDSVLDGLVFHDNKGDEVTKLGRFTDSSSMVNNYELENNEFLVGVQGLYGS